MEVEVNYTAKEITFYDATLEELSLTLVQEFLEEEFGDFKILIA